MDNAMVGLLLGFILGWMIRGAVRSPIDNVRHKIRSWI